MLTRPAAPGQSPSDMTIWFDDRAVAAITATRTTPVTGSPRGPFRMMGACFECLAVVDGRANVQTCMVLVRDGMRVEQQQTARTIAGDP